VNSNIQDNQTNRRLSKKLKYIFTLSLLAALVASQAYADINWSQTKIAPPSTGMYFGQYEWQPGDISTVETAAGINTAFPSSNRGHWGFGYVNGYPHLDVAQANNAWDDGRVIIVQAFNTMPGEDDEHPVGFTVDKLLRGVYDAKLKIFAAELRSFGKPVWFQVGREPNGIGQDWFGGFGPNGDKSIQWAIENNSAFSYFKPPVPPSGAPSKFYLEVASINVCDGVERLKAAQRYYYDFFVRREKLNFLTFDTQGWAVHRVQQIDFDVAEYPASQQPYARQVLTSCHNFKNFYPGDAYVDWVSLNFYMLDYYRSGFPSYYFPKDYIIPIDEWLNALATTVKQVLTVTSKSILITELGFPDGMNADSALAATKVTKGLQALIDNYKQSIKGFILWANHPSWMQPDIFPYDTLIQPGTKQGTALHTIVQNNPGVFKSCVVFTNGLAQPNC
jgi:hypothetical protein